MKSHNLFILAITGLSLCAGAHAATQYSFAQLNLNSAQGTATDINNNGAVAGILYSNPTQQPWCLSANHQPYMHKNGVLSIIGTEQNAICLGTGQSIDINDNDVVAGTLNSRAFRYQNGTLTQLNSNISSAHAINSNGLIGGSVGDCPSNATLFENGNSTTIAAGSCGATWPVTVALNDLGHALISASGRYGSNSSQLFKDGVLQDVPGLNTSGFPNHYARDLNNNGQIVGTNQGVTYLAHNGNVTDLGSLVVNGQTLYVTPTAINNNGVIVGTARDTNGNTRGVIYENGQWVDLNSKVPNAGAWIDTAEDINDSGAIVGRSYSGQYGGYKLTPAISEDIRRTVIFIYGTTSPGQDMFIRGGLDWAQAKTLMGKDCAAVPVDVNKWLCAIPMSHLGKFAGETTRANDKYLDWYGAEPNQGNVQGSPLVWTTNVWPAEWGAKKTVANDGYGEDPQNTWGQHYWKLDVMMDCSKTYNGWFEVKSYISNGPGWESNVSQQGRPYASGNHFGQCGKINKFIRGNSSVEIRNF
jgi:probable HAF family extracellular repeat protein